MGNLYVASGGSGGVDCDNATAKPSDILAWKTAGIAGYDELVTGTMPNRGSWSTSVGMNGSTTIPNGYHNGNGKVTGPSVTQRGAWNSSVGMNGRVSIPEGYHNGSGKVTGPSIPVQNAEVDGDRVNALSISNASGQVNLKVRNGYYLNGVNWVKGSIPNFVASNIRKGVNIGGIVGTFEGMV